MKVDTGVVHHCSAIRLMESLDKHTAELVILDPPTFLGVGDSEDAGVVDEMIAELVPLSEAVAVALKPGGAAVVMGGPQMMSAWEIVAGWVDLKYTAEITVLWDRDMSDQTLASAVRWYLKPGLRFGRTSHMKLDSNVIVCNEVPYEERYSPTQRPVELFNYLISIFTRPGGVVVDPFCGTGSALVSADMCFRPWIGGDADESMVRIAERRTKLSVLEEAHLQPIHTWNQGRLTAVEG